MLNSQNNLDFAKVIAEKLDEQVKRKGTRNSDMLGTRENLSNALKTLERSAPEAEIDGLAEIQAKIKAIGSRSAESADTREYRDIVFDWYAEDDRERLLSAPNTNSKFQPPKNVFAVEDADNAVYNRSDDRALVNDWYNGNVPANVLELIDSPEAGQNIQSLIAKGDRPEPVLYSYNSQLGAEIGKAIKKGTVAIRDILGQEVSLMTTVGAYVLDMNVDGDGIYHADFDCWQSAFGYNDFYDKVFDTFTEMDKDEFPFEYKGKKYKFWAWKGDYLNLGAGAELGIYEDVFGDDGRWAVDKSLAMKMSMTLQYTDPNTGIKSTVFQYNPSEAQWWITGFNPKYVDKDFKDSDLTAYYTVIFDSKEMYDAFYKMYGPGGEKPDSRWIFLTPSDYPSDYDRPYGYTATLTL